MDETKEMEGEHKQCPILKEYLCSECKDDCKMEIKSKIYVDGGKKGDYIAQKIAFRREMEMNYAKLLDENFNLRSELQKAKELNGELVVGQEQQALNLVRLGDLLDRCYHFMTNMSKMTNSELESILEEINYYRSEALIKKSNQSAMHDYSAQQLKEYRDVIRELLPLAELAMKNFHYEGLTIKQMAEGFPDDQLNDIKTRIERARKLIDQTDSTK